MTSRNERARGRRSSCPRRRLGAAVVELRVEVIPRWAVSPAGLRRARRRAALPRRRARAAAARRRPARRSCASRRRARAACSSAPARRDRDDAAAAIARMRFALAVDDDLSDVLRALPRRPAHRAVGAAPAVAAHRAPAGRLRGARVGGLRAAHRLAARSRDPAADRLRALGPRCAAERPARRPVGGRPRRAARPRAWSPSTSPAGGRSRSCASRARSPRGASTSTAPITSTRWRRLLAVPTIGRWTVEMLAAHGQGRYDVAPGRRPRTTSSCSAAGAAAATRPRAPRRPRCGRCSSASARGAGWRPSTRSACPAPAARARSRP